MNSDNLKIYNGLAKEFTESGNLDEKDRLLLYKLFQENDKANSKIMYDLINSLISRKRYNERYILAKKERIEIFNILEGKRISESGLTRYEYNYFCFLVWKYNLTSEVSLPCIPNVSHVSLEGFKRKLVYNEHRSSLYQIFLRGLKQCCHLYNLSEIEVYVGGSYRNEFEKLPDDIDVVIVLPGNEWKKDRDHHILNTIIREFKLPNSKNTFDLHKTLCNVSDNHYMYYEMLTLMGNSPEKKLEEGIKSMKYDCREIYRIQLKSSDLPISG